MSGQGYVSSALARYLIEYFIDTFLVDPRQTLVQALINLEEESLRTPVAAVVEDQLIPVQARQTQEGENLRSPIGLVMEDKLTPLQARPNEEDGSRKGDNARRPPSHYAFELPLYLISNRWK